MKKLFKTIFPHKIYRRDYKGGAPHRLWFYSPKAILTRLYNNYVKTEESRNRDSQNSIDAATYRTLKQQGRIK